MNSLQRQRMRRYGSNNHIEGIFRRGEEIKQAVWEAKKNDSRGHTGGGNSGHALVSDDRISGVQVEEVREVTLPDGYNVRWPERWLRVIDATYEKYPAVREHLD